MKVLSWMFGNHLRCIIMGSIKFICVLAQASRKSKLTKFAVVHNFILIKWRAPIFRRGKEMIRWKKRKQRESKRRRCVDTNTHARTHAFNWVKWMASLLKQIKHAKQLVRIVLALLAFVFHQKSCQHFCKNGFKCFVRGNKITLNRYYYSIKCCWMSQTEEWSEWVSEMSVCAYVYLTCSMFTSFQF